MEIQIKPLQSHGETVGWVADSSKIPLASSFHLKLELSHTEFISNLRATKALNHKTIMPENAESKYPKLDKDLGRFEDMRVSYLAHGILWSALFFAGVVFFLSAQMNATSGGTIVAFCLLFTASFPFVLFILYITSFAWRILIQIARVLIDIEENTRA